MSRALSFVLWSALPLAGCSKRAIVEEANEDQVIEIDYSYWDGAELQILSPSSNAFIPLGEEADFEAAVFYEDGTDSGWSDVTWASSEDEEWLPWGAAFTDDTLPAGMHTLSAYAALPNGQRVGWSVGGVMVQHEDAGLYSGDLIVEVTVDYNGAPLSTTTVGLATLLIDETGATALGTGSATISAMGYELDAAHAFDLEVEDGDVSGTVSIDAMYTTLDFEVDGSVGDGLLEAEWEGNLFGYADIAGQLSLTRLSRSTEGVE